MKLLQKYFGTIISILLAVLMANMVLPVGASVQPYTVDSATLHLWHFDETATPCEDAAPAARTSPT